MQTLHRADTYETLRTVAIILIAIQVVVAALLMMPAAPQVPFAGLLALMFLNFVALIAMFQMPVPPVLRLGFIVAMLILLLVIGAKSDPLGLRQIDQEVSEGTASVESAAAAAPSVRASGPTGARLTVAGQGVAPIDTRLGGAHAEGLAITMRVVEADDAAVLIDWSIGRESVTRRCGRITLFASYAALMSHLEPILARSIERSVAAGAPTCN